MPVPNRRRCLSVLASTATFSDPSDNGRLGSTLCENEPVAALVLHRQASLVRVLLGRIRP